MQAQQSVELLGYTPEPEEMVARAGKLCYSKSGIQDINRKLTKNEVSRFVHKLAEMGHESPIEHITFNFGVEGVSRSLTHQLVRHRLASYSHQSQRYVRLDQFEYVSPPRISRCERARKEFVAAMEEDQEHYDFLVEEVLYNECLLYCQELSIEASDPYQYVRDNLPKKFKELEKGAIEDARYVFPNACETKIMVSMNARSLLNFFSLRCCRRAQWEIRDLAYKMLYLVKEVAPSVFKYAGPPCVRGSCPEGDMSCGNPVKF